MGPIHIGDQQTEHCANECDAIIDSGHSLVKGPPSMINDINKAIGADIVTRSVHCGKISSMPTISFTINGRTFPISPKDYIEIPTIGDDLKQPNPFF
ncbi:unnamed protein product [Arabis nemorensis]|uniref:Peptidase A1 domain-containing protein n=1 Tax=Arabis nemorensis TaxID=586526 RepID=A0A565CEJ5_9BRAS|nr:unnamed protein product [Arabis nemorensis]